MAYFINIKAKSILLFLLAAQISLTSFSQSLNVKDFGADPSGRMDNSSLLNALIDSLSRSGGGTVFVPSGNYLLDDAIVLKPNICLKGQGPDKTIFIRNVFSEAWSKTKAQAILTTDPSTINENVTVENLQVDAKYSKNELNGKGGVCLRNTRNSKILNVHTTNTWHGVAFYDYKGDSSNNLIENVVSTNAHAFSVAGNTGRPRGVLTNDFGSQVKNTKSINAGTGFYANGKNITLINCHAENWFIDNGFYLIVDNLKVSDCSALGGPSPSEGFGSGFAIAYKRNGLIENCTATNCSNYGFRIHVPQSELTLTNNSAIGCGIGFGIETASHPFPEVSDRIHLINNIAENSGLNGFLFRQMTNSVVSGNKAINGNQRGLTLSTRGAIALKEYLSENTFSDNDCIDNQGKKTQIYGLYDYSKSQITNQEKRGKNNKITHSSKNGIDDF